MNRRTAAEAQYRLAVDSFEQQIQKYEAAAQQWIASGNPQEAAVATANAGEGRKNEAEAYNALGLLHALGRRDPAADYRKAIDLNDRLAVAWHNWANYLDAAGDRAQAVTNWQNAVAVDGSFVPSRLKLGEASLRSSDSAAAENQFRAVLSGDPDNREAKIGLIRALVGRDLPAALREARAAGAATDLRLRPDFQKTMGDLYFAQHNGSEACEWYRRAQTGLKRAAWVGTPEELHDLSGKVKGCKQK